MIWEIDGVTVGHWTDPIAQTGCTVVLFDPAAVASGEVRGGAPASHELALLDPTSTVQRIDAVVLSGGSAFGLASTIGVTAWCEEAGRGLETIGGRVPIVVGMSLFDLGEGEPVAPDAESGYRACALAANHAAAGSPPVELGRVGGIHQDEGADLVRIAPRVVLHVQPAEGMSHQHVGRLQARVAQQGAQRGSSQGRPAALQAAA